MAVYYVDPVNGSNSNNGLGPDASHATNKPFLTIGKLIASSGVMASGDTAYLAPGAFREAVTVNITSPTAETKILGDPSNAQGFKTSGGVLVASGPVRWTAYTTDDKTAPGTSHCLNLNGRDFFTFENLYIQSNSSGSSVSGDTTTPTNITFRNCVFAAYLVTPVRMTAAFGVALAWTFERCVFFSLQNTLLIVTHTSGTGSDWDLNVQVKNCLFFSMGGVGINVAKSGSSTNVGGGVDALNCTFFNENAFTISTGVSATIPCTVYNSYFAQAFTGAAVLQAPASPADQLLEDYNYFFAQTLRSNVTAGANSKTNGTWSYHLDFFYCLMNGFAPKPFFSPLLDSPVLGLGNQSGSPDVDFLNRPRPSGTGMVINSVNKGAGAFEVHDFARKETGTVDVSPSIVLLGPGDQELQVPVDASSTTISIKARYDTNHATTNKPRVTLLANAEIGVTEEIKTMTEAVDTWETLTFTAFTPTAKGWVTIRLESRSAAGNGKAFFDTASVS